MDTKNQEIAEETSQLVNKTFRSRTWNEVEKLVLKYEIGDFEEGDPEYLTAVVRRLVAESRYYESR